jgi:hypothetical protein
MLREWRSTIAHEAVTAVRLNVPADCTASFWSEDTDEELSHK